MCTGYGIWQRPGIGSVDNAGAAFMAGYDAADIAWGKNG
ncbi:hypothetical protein GLA29479_3589 [Lysobacter antibioticus]|jgi:hypothetical protein|uniref:Uncharacterized protein n=1 Tax=Lysobacter antibioticus TaxID=84531 RepID=A0A0S2E0R0_LYSAN|nr:hypothetical protein GLA29479_3589 [Lysobacter antibioticus]ALN82114.1 hypothetical protein LA76x_3998 [Lysobacter antibioticus]